MEQLCLHYFEIFFYFFRLTRAKTARTIKLVDKKAAPSPIHPLNHEKSISFSDYINSLIQFWSIIEVPSAIKSESENKFECLGRQKVDFYVVSKKSIFNW